MGTCCEVSLKAYPPSGANAAEEDSMEDEEKEWCGGDPEPEPECGGDGELWFE